MTKRRRSVRLVVLIAVIMGVLAAEAVLVAAVFVSPTTGTKLSGVVQDVSRAWTGTKHRAGIRGRVAGVVHRGYESWIVPLWSEPQTPPGQAEFTACVKCHADYATKRKYSAVYMDHPLHAELGVACGTCHKENTHPNPVLPDEAVCAKCHKEVGEKDKCGLCHPPASLPHFYLLGAPREGVVDCTTCHPRKTFEKTATVPLVHAARLNGTDRSICLSCHQATTCQQCHGQPHPSNWISTHGPLVGGGGPVDCYTCHTGTWCADRCHDVTSSNPFVPKPLPTVGVRP